MKDVMTETEKHDLLFTIKLNQLVLDLLTSLAKYYESSSKLILTINVDKLNTAYIYAVVLLENLYDNNITLADIPSKPIWENVKTPKGNELDIMLEFENGIFANQQKHIGELERIWTLCKNDKIELLPKEEQLLNKTNNIINDFNAQLGKRLTKHNKFNTNYDEVIFELTRGKDYVLRINGKYLSKTNVGSINDKIMDKCFESPNKIVKFRDCGIPKTKRRTQAILSDLGFKPAPLHKVFFPIADEERIMLRPKVTRQMLVDDEIDYRKFRKWLP